MKTLIWNKKDNSIRGSFVNLMITLVILLLIFIGAFSDAVAKRLADMAALIIGFFTSTMGIWAYRKVKETCNETEN
jgi:TRAP-type C4-dicarboxylate transport system permease large subunit